MKRVQESDRIRRVSQLEALDLTDLLADRLLALVVENYCSPNVCKDISRALLASSEIERYTHEVISENGIEQNYFGVDRLGQPFNSVYAASAEDAEHKLYYELARPAIARLRRLCAPHASPLDRFRLELDEAFVPGATTASFEGRKMLAGIARITRASLSQLSADEPHFDALPEKYCALDAQLAVNIYLKVPDQGGELEIWDVPPLTPLSSAPASWRAQLPEPHALAPTSGDLIIFNCRRPHAIRAFEGEDRVSLQMFVGHKKGEPLQLWN